MYNVKISKLTDIELAKEAISASVMGGMESNLKSLKKIYASEHSPMYTQMYVVDMHVPYYISTHLRTHKKNFNFEVVSSNRPDRNGGAKADRDTIVRMIIMLNAKSLVDIAKKRLCLKADTQAVKLMGEIVNVLVEMNDEIAGFMVPNCIYRNGLCGEFKPCGYLNTKSYAEAQKRYNLNFTKPKEVNHE